MGLASAQVVAGGWSEYKGDVVLAEIRCAKTLDEHEAYRELYEWVARHGGKVATEVHRGRWPQRVVGASRVIYLPDAVVPS